MRTVAAAILAALPAAAAAENPHLAAAIRLYNDFEYEAALAQLDKAAKWSANTAADDVTVAVYTGLVRGELGDENGAATAFKIALALDASVAPPVGVSPKIRAVFHRARGEFLKANPQQPKAAVGPAPPAAASPAAPMELGLSRAPASVAAAPAPAVSTTVSAPIRAAVEVPPTSPTAAAAPAPAVPSPSSPNFVGIALAAGGVLAAGTGGYFGLQSGQQFTEARNQFFQSDAVQKLAAARGTANTANILFIAAAVALALSGAAFALRSSD